MSVAEGKVDTKIQISGTIRPHELKRRGDIHVFVRVTNLVKR